MPLSSKAVEALVGAKFLIRQLVTERPLVGVAGVAGVLFDMADVRGISEA